MGIIPLTCPHCGTVAAAFQTIGGTLDPEDGGGDPHIHEGSCAAVCPSCYNPVAARLRNMTSNRRPVVKELVSNFINGPYPPDTYDLVVTDIWPKPPEPSIPEHVPEHVARALLQAERNYPTKGNEEASAMMYRRSLELTLKDKFPSLTGTLAARIKQLVANSTLPEAMGDWADEIRALGNDAAHDAQEVDRKQLTLIRGFTDATLRYLYTLPAEIDARRKLT